MHNFKILINSELFDYLHYEKSARKTFFNRKSAARHYLKKGWKLGYNPSSQFDTQWFLHFYPQAEESGICPLIYYLKYGRRERMYPSPDIKKRLEVIVSSSLFDHEYYADQLDIVFSNRFCAAEHYLSHGWHISPSKYFDADYYLKANKDVAQKGINPLLHYEQSGAEEGRQPHGEIHSIVLDKVETIFRQGSVQDARSHLCNLMAQFIDRTPEQDAAMVLRAEVDLLCGDYSKAEIACQLVLDKGWKASRSFIYNRACGLLVQTLCEQDRYRDANACVIRAYQHLNTWNAAALTCLRQTLTTQADLAFFSGLVTPAIEKNDDFTTHALLQYALAARDTGNMSLALALIKQCYIKGVRDIHAYGCEPSQEDSSWQEEARLALTQIKECLDNAGIPFFLISGTLLGCVRDRDIIRHDNDIDIGVMADIPLDAIKAAFKGKGYFTVLPYIHDKLLRVRHVNGVMADVFIHWEQDGRLYHEGRRTGWWNTAFSLVKVDFLGETYYIPDNVKQYLEENYGNWAIPDKKFDTFSDTPNMYVANQEELVWYFYRKLLEEYKSGNADSYQRIWQALCKAEDQSLKIQALYHMSFQEILLMEERSNKIF